MKKEEKHGHALFAHRGHALGTTEIGIPSFQPSGADDEGLTPLKNLFSEYTMSSEETMRKGGETSAMANDKANSKRFASATKNMEGWKS